MFLLHRTPQNYDGPLPTTRHIRDLLPPMMQKISRSHAERGDLLFAAWPEVIGPQLAPMTRPLSFKEGVLTINVNNSTLYSLLNTYEKTRLLQQLRHRFPMTTITNLLFRIG